MTVLARMVCNKVVDFGSSKQVDFHPVYSNDPASPNYSFSKATPNGSLSLTITNPDAFDQFKPMGVYDITISEYVEPAKAAQ